MGKTETRAGKRTGAKRGEAPRKGRSPSKRGKRKNRQGAKSKAQVRGLKKTNDELARRLAALEQEKEKIESERSELSEEVSRLRERCAEHVATIEEIQAGKGEPAGEAVPAPSTRPAGGRQAERGDFWREKSIEELAEEQGVKPITRLEEVLGRGADLWESDEEFERFVNGIYERRRREVTQ